MKSWLRRVWPFGWTGVSVVLVALSSFLVATHELGAWPWIDRRPLRERYYFRYVSRTDLNPVLNAPGRLESSKRTIVRCELENLAGASGGGSSTILTVLPEGTIVKRGDVLATLDGSTYEEMLRQQAITVEQAKASHLQVQLNHEIALLAVREYREGTVQETLKGMEGTITLARSDLSRAQDHLTWTKRMNEKGYASAAQIVSEKHTVAQLELALQRQLTSMELFQRFTLPKTEKNLQGQVKSAETSLGNETPPLATPARTIQVAPKTSRPLYDSRPPRWRFALQQRSSTVRPPSRKAWPSGKDSHFSTCPTCQRWRCRLFSTSPLYDRVSPGQRVTVTFEAVPKLVLQGRVLSVGQMPFRQMAGGGASNKWTPAFAFSSASSNSTVSPTSSSPA